MSVEQEIIKVSPKLLEWIHRTPSNRIAVHKDRWKVPGDVEVEKDVDQDDTDI